MNDLKVVIDAGHGGSDPGAVGNGLNEKDLTLKISQYMYQRFKELGVPVVLVRETDETVNPTERVNRILNAFGNTPNIIVISNHINAAGTAIKGAQGAEVIYALRNDDTLAKKILEEIGKEGQITRTYYQRRSTTDPTQDYYFILRNTKNTQPVIVEYGFIDNATDIDRVQKNYKQYVDAVVRAVLEVNGWETPISNNETYIVKAGDTLWNLAKRFDTTVANLKSLNNLTTDTLSIGQILQVPTENEIITETTYIVKAGDTLWNLAKRFNTTVADLKSLNSLTSDTLSIGQVLLLSQDNEPSNLTQTYIVKAGDSLWKIANQFKTTVDAIKQENQLTSDNLNIGQVLTIPNLSNITPKTYVVQAGDSLWKIANQFKTTVTALKELNDLTSNVLEVGQTLYIP